jgi:hypothetical protein
VIVAFQSRYDAETTVYIDLSAVVMITFDNEEFEIDISSTTDPDSYTRVNIILDKEDETSEQAKARILKLWNIARRRI